MGQMELPLARTDALVVEQLRDETLVYDRRTDVAHCLGPVASRIWRACDGERDFVRLAAIAGVDEDLAIAAVAALDDQGLLARDPALATEGAARVSRSDGSRGPGSPLRRSR
jgi:hypothetical protein